MSRAISSARTKGARVECSAVDAAEVQIERAQNSARARECERALHAAKSELSDLLREVTTLCALARETKALRMAEEEKLQRAMDIADAPEPKRGSEARLSARGDGSTIDIAAYMDVVRRHAELAKRLDGEIPNLSS